ncbi:MAG TPA: acyltransferase domain-containing protein, partial [Gemmata sp.]|nr:acyltransferase domain-containing protein [Gemmata sp.]
GRPEDSLRRMLHLPPDATATERSAAEASLRQLGPSIFGVLLADQAIYRVLQNLQLPVSAVAGHSAGELGALLASGAMRSQEHLGTRLVEIMDIMQRQESESGGPEAALLAVGAGKAAVQEAARKVASVSVVVAMDNCPHQCVAVGPAQEIAAVEAEILARGLVCERLPFRRPYHTPLFEPWMGAFRELFANIPFEKPLVPVYSCSTGSRFPDSPAAMRELAVNHWVSPVEFTRMIETMYADGVRLFVEAGPRGNLSAFVEDVLRGKPLAAIPANVQRKSGPTQINHLVAQLVAHHVPVNLSHLHASRRDDTPHDVNGSARIHPGTELPEEIERHFAVMEQFLDVQREVMEAFLRGRTSSGGSLPEALAFVDFSAALDAVEREVPQTAPGAEDAFCLVGEIVQHEPGREIVFRRVLDEREDLYADHHTLGGRAVSRTDPTQNGMPVLPMTFSLEAMGEAASLLVPGKVVIAIRNVRLYRWIPFESKPTTLEVRVASSSTNHETGVVELKGNVRDLGNSFYADAANKVACEAVVVLADHYPEPPAPHPFHLTDEQHCRATVEDLRRNMFHGPLFQMLRTLERYGKEGIEGLLEVQPRDGWFATNPAPRTIIDPVLVDSAMHIIGAWHLEQPDWSGRILLPIGMQSLEFFSPPPPVGSFMLVRGHNEKETAREARHGLEAFNADGRMWYRLTGASYWRFYLPFGHVNFFGPKDEYFLSRDWPEAVEQRTENSPPRRCHYLEPPPDMLQPVLRAAGARITMTRRELEEFYGWTGNDQGLNDWLFTRLLAKDAIRSAWFEKHHEAMFPADIELEWIDGRLTSRPRGESKAEPFPAATVASVGGAVVSFAAFTERVGIGLLEIPKGMPETDARMQAARLAVADALHISAEGLKVEKGETQGTFLVIHAGRRLRVQTARKKNVVAATTTCEVEAS